jgi:hypothetical protein
MGQAARVNQLFTLTGTVTLQLTLSPLGSTPPLACQA